MMTAIRFRGTRHFGWLAAAGRRWRLGLSWLAVVVAGGAARDAGQIMAGRLARTHARTHAHTCSSQHHSSTGLCPP